MFVERAYVYISVAWRWPRIGNRGRGMSLNKQKNAVRQRMKNKSHGPYHCVISLSCFSFDNLAKVC